MKDFFSLRQSRTDTTELAYREFGDTNNAIGFESRQEGMFNIRTVYDPYAVVAGKSAQTLFLMVSGLFIANICNAVIIAAVLYNTIIS